MNNSAIFSKEDEELYKISWRQLSGYLVNCDSSNKINSAHRMVMERVLNRQLQAFEIVDHINRNILDNRRENLRLTDKRGNSRNKKNNKIHPNIQTMLNGKYAVRMRINGKVKCFGRFWDIYDAVLKRDEILTNIKCDRFFYKNEKSNLPSAKIKLKATCLETNKIFEFDSIIKAAKALNVQTANISKVLAGTRAHTKKYIFEKVV